MISNYSVRKPFTVFVAIILILILGFVSFNNISTDLLPSINLPYSVIITPYVGASPEEVELVVTKTIEQSMASISNIKSVQSISRENMSLVILEFGESTNMDSAVIEMRENLDMLGSYMPDGVGTSTIMKLNPDMMPIMVVSAAVDGQKISESSAFLQDKIIPELESIEGVASVDASGLIESEIHVIIKQEKIDAINQQITNAVEKQIEAATEQAQAAMAKMSPAELAALAASKPQETPATEIPKVAISKEMVSGILKGQNFSMPTGYITEDGVDYLIRTGDAIEGYDALKSLTLMVLPFEGMAPITLEDVADVMYVSNSDEMYSKVNGIDAITLTIQKQTSYVTSDVTNDLLTKMFSLEARYPNLKMVTLMNQGEYIDIVVNSLLNNLIIGGLLAILILLLFLRDLKPTFVVGFSIPISVIAAFVLMYFSHITLNIISMGGLALGVGMLVDNSIVVIENIYRMRSEGKSAIEASVEGAKQVSGAIIASTLTTIAVFLPIVFIEGFTREIFTDMALTIAYSLLASLMVALTLVPTMASKMLIKEVKQDHKVFAKLKAGYTKVLEFALDHKVLVITVILLLFAGSIYGITSMGTQLFPTSDSGQLTVTLEMPIGSKFETLTKTADEVTEQLQTLNSIESIGATIGGGMFNMSGLGAAGSSGNSVTFYITLKDNRSQSTEEISSELTTLITSDKYKVSVTGTDMNMGALSGGDISIEIKGRDFADLEKIATDIAAIVSSVEGTKDVSSGIEETAPELKLVVDKDASVQKGLTVAQVFVEVNKLLSASSKSTSINVDGNDLNVVVMDESDLDPTSRKDILDLNLTTPQGETIKVGDIATLEETSGFKSIKRTDQQRYVTVTGSLADGYNVGLVSDEIQKKLNQYSTPDGYTIEMTGENKTIKDSFTDLSKMLLLAIVFIYLIMVSQFQSLLSPFIVMFTIPLAFTGGFFALLITGLPLSIVAFIGLIILTGVVVNNGIVFVDYANKMRESGLSKREALIKTGTDRLRPILMTALTTIIALSTMSLGTGTGTEMMQPMAITTIGGLIYATLLTLIFIPVLFDIFHKKDLRKSNA
ncbi:efflux RND transporter permease subunit [Fusibacter bizertensis]